MKKITRRIMTVMLSMMMVFALSISAFADGMTQEQAMNIALGDAGLAASDVIGLKVEADTEDGVFEVDFTNSKKTEYDYEISAADGTIFEKSVEYKVARSKSKKKIGKKAAQKKVAKASGIEYSVVSKGSCKYKKSRKGGKYEIKFRSGGCKYEYEILASSGKVLEYDWELIR
ncbi:MAG: PepSY domain-containing protein [Mogibacterium sp.]|nr:PepSY domain-containing protein [Mogibacterium sp.]